MSVAVVWHEESYMKFFTTATAIAALLCVPATAHAQFDGRTLVGGAIGAGIGGVIGSNLAGGGVQDEGTAIGAVLGGLAGASIANRTRSNYGNYYGGGHGYGHGNAYGGGYGYAGRSRYGSGYSYGSGHSYGGGHSGHGYGGGYGYGGGNVGGGFAPVSAPVYPTYYAPSGQYVTSTYSYPTVSYPPAVTYQMPVSVTPVSIPRATTYTSNYDVTYADSSVRLAGPPIQSYDRYVGVTRTEQMPTAHATREVVQGDCPAGTSYQSDGTCLQAGTIGGSSYSGSQYSWSSDTGTSYSGSSHSGGGTVWTGGSEHFNESTGQYDHGWRERQSSCAATTCGSSMNVGSVPTTSHKVWSHSPSYTTTVHGGSSCGQKSHTTYDYESSSRCN